MKIEDGPVGHIGIALRMCASAQRFLDHEGGDGKIAKHIVITFLADIERLLTAHQALPAQPPPVPYELRSDGFNDGFN